MADILKHVPSDELSNFELETFGVGPELKSKTKTTSTVVSKPSFKEPTRRSQKQQKQKELQDKLRNQREKERIAFQMRYGDKYDFKPPAPKPKVLKSKQVNFIRPELVSVPEVSEQRCLISADEVKFQPRVDASIEEEFKVISHPMIPTPVDRTAVLNTGRTILDTNVVVIKNENQISKTAAKKNRSKLSKGNFAFNLQGKPINMNTQNMEQNELSTPVLEVENSFFRKPSESDSDDFIITKSKIVSKDDFLLEQTKKKKKLSKKASTKTAKTNNKMEEQPKVEQPIESPVLDTKIEDPVEQSTEHQTESTKIDSESQTDSIVAPHDEIVEMRATIKLQEFKLNSQQFKIDQLEKLLSQAIQRLDALEVEKAQVAKVRKMLENRPIPRPIPTVQPVEQPCTSSSLIPPISEPVQKPVATIPDPVRETAKQRKTKFVDDGNNLRVNFNRAKTIKETLEVVKNHLTKPKSELAKAVDQEVRDVSAERVVKPFAERLQENLEKSVQKFKVSQPVIVRIARDPTRPQGLPAKVWEKIKTLIPETEVDFQEKRDLAVAKKFKFTFHARRQILVNKWAKVTTKSNPYLLNPIQVWKTVGVIGEGDTSIFNNIEKWADMAATFTLPGVDKEWAKQDV